MTADRFQQLISAEKIDRRVSELARLIENDYDGKNPIVVCILKGSMVFCSDLIRKTELQLRLDTMSVSSYGKDTVTSGNIKIVKDLDESIAGEDIIIVEDIVDSGITLKSLTKLIAERGAKSVRVCAFLDKPSGRRTEFVPDYVGFEISDVFVVGYGMDYAEKYRNLPYVAALRRVEG